MGTKILIDNASLDRILLWPERAQEELRRSLSGHRFTVYFAPETIAEMLAIGATRNASRLPELASLVTALLNGRIFQDYFSVLKHEVKGDRTSPFLGEGDKRAILKRLSSLATHGIPDDREWFLHGESLIRKEKERDSQWRKGFQELYRGRPQEMKKSGVGRVTLDEFRAHPSVKHLVSSRVEATCIEVGLPDPAHRARQLLESMERLSPVLHTHITVRTARLWWYTESSPEGRRASEDEFDDALLVYMADLDWLVTPDCGLQSFFRITYPQKQVLNPDEFQQRV